MVIFASLCFLISGCGDGNYSRGYVISKAQVEQEADKKAEE